VFRSIPSHFVWSNYRGAGQGIFAKDDFAKLAAQLASIQGKFILSLNDTAGVRKTFKGFMLESVKVNYSCSNGKNMKASEVIIKNF
jgi:DNA adenine methylase